MPTEEQRAEMLTKKAEYAKRVEAELSRRRTIVANVAATDSGKQLIGMLRLLCGFDRADRVVDADGKLDPVGTSINVERRNVYIQIRNLVPVEILRDIEFPPAEVQAKAEEKLNK